MNAKQNGQADSNHHDEALVATAPITVSSSAFTNGSPIPQRYSCQGDNISPGLAWGAPPSGTQSFALVCEDPDAPSGLFVHWVLYNIPSTERGLAENIPTKDSLTNGTHQGKNGANKTGYTGPCPPPGKPHRYYFKVFALDEKLTLTGDVDHDKLMSAIQGHVLGEGEVMGTYQRQ